MSSEGKEQPSRSADEIRADIAATRAELEHTADALSAKLDVRKRLRGWFTDPANRPQLIAAGVAVVAVVALAVTKKVRS